jgi:hypothetical protein
MDPEIGRAGVGEKGGEPCAVLVARRAKGLEMGEVGSATGRGGTRRVMLPVPHKRRDGAAIATADVEQGSDLEKEPTGFELLQGGAGVMALEKACHKELIALTLELETRGTLIQLDPEGACELPGAREPGARSNLVEGSIGMGEDRRAPMFSDVLRRAVSVGSLGYRSRPDRLPDGNAMAVSFKDRHSRFIHKSAATPRWMTVMISFGPTVVAPPSLPSLGRRSAPCTRAADSDSDNDARCRKSHPPPAEQGRRAGLAGIICSFVRSLVISPSVTPIARARAPAVCLSSVCCTELPRVQVRMAIPLF